MRPNEIGDGSLEREREVPEDGRWNPILNKGKVRDVDGQSSILVKSSNSTRVWTEKSILGHRSILLILLVLQNNLIM